MRNDKIYTSEAEVLKDYNRVGFRCPKKGELFISIGHLIFGNFKEVRVLACPAKNWKIPAVIVEKK